MKKLFGIGLVLSSMVALVACGSKHSDTQKDPEPTVNAPDNSQVQNPPTNNTPGDTTPPTPTGTGTNPPPPPVETLNSCLAGCEGKYPKAAQENKDLDTKCMLGSCVDVCNDLGTPGKNFGPDPVVPDGGVACDTVAADAYPISTPSILCSSCLSLSPTCCSIWISIFGSDDGRSLNSCANTCYTKFPAK